MIRRIRGRIRPDERGSALILIVFYAGLALVVVLIVTAITSLYLERTRLMSLADSSALVGAEAFDLTEVRVVDGHPTVDLTDEHVQNAVAEFLDDRASDGFEGLTLDSAGTVDGRSATVRISAWWRPPVLTVILPEGIRIDVTSIARSVFD